MKYQRPILQPPYTWLQNIDVSERDYGVPTDVIACEMRIWGAVKGSISIKTPRTTKSSLHVATQDGDIFRLEILKVYRIGTTSELRNTITLFGFLKSDFNDYL